MVTTGEKPSATQARCCCDMKPMAIVAIKTVHSIAFAVIQSCIVYLLYKGLRQQSDRKAAVAATVALGESAIYAANGFRCPLTDLAERLGSEHGAVTDIFLPKWLAANVARIYTPLLLLAIALHVRNLRRHSSPVTGGSN